VKALCCLYRK